MNLAALKENPVKKLEYINSLAASGKSRDEIARALGYKDTGSLRSFTRRHGYTWNNSKRLYVIMGENKEPEIKDIPTGKEASIISMLNRGVEGKEIARRLRFSSQQEMADYMRAKGYVWDDSIWNYRRAIVKDENVKDNVMPEQKEEKIISSGNCKCIERFGDILSILESNKDKISEILSPKSSVGMNIPRYSLPGVFITKSIDIPNMLDRLVKDYSSDKDISQREIMKVALIDFLIKYGYENEVKSAFHI